MDNVAKSTPIQQLPSGNQPTSQASENQVVQDILQEIQNTQPNPNSVPNHPSDANNQHGLMRQMDSGVQPTQVVPHPTPEQITEMSTNNAPNLYQGGAQPATTPKKNFLASFGMFNINLFEEMKHPIVVFLLVFFSNQTFFNQFLLKVPTAVNSTGQITLIGNIVKALGVASIFMVFSKFF